VTNIIGIYKADDFFKYIVYDLLVVIALLNHIQRLKRHGLYGVSVSSSSGDTQSKLGPILSFVAGKLGDQSKITQFFKRVVWTPRPFTTSSKRVSVLRKKGTNYFSLVFVLKIILFVFTLLYVISPNSNTQMETQTNSNTGTTRT
jgi:hypothetical protein